MLQLSRAVWSGADPSTRGWFTGEILGAGDRTWAHLNSDASTAIPTVSVASPEPDYAISAARGTRSTGA